MVLERQEILNAEFGPLTKNSHQDNGGTVHIYLQKQAELSFSLKMIHLSCDLYNFPVKL